jgi:hypothetical protein
MQWFNFNLQDFSVSFLSILFEGACPIMSAFADAITLRTTIPLNIGTISS